MRHLQYLKISVLGKFHPEAMFSGVYQWCTVSIAMVVEVTAFRSWSKPAYGSHILFVPSVRPIRIRNNQIRHSRGVRRSSRSEI